MKIVALLLWTLVPVAGFAALNHYGTAHVIWTYRFLDNGDASNPYLERTYVSCTYAGWTWHEVTAPALDGHCPWIRFFKIEVQ